MLWAEAGLKRLACAAAAVRLVLGHSYFWLPLVAAPLFGYFILVSQPWAYIRWLRDDCVYHVDHPGSLKVMDIDFTGSGLQTGVISRKVNSCFALLSALGVYECLFVHERGYPGLCVIPLHWHSFLWHEDKWNWGQRAAEHLPPATSPAGPGWTRPDPPGPGPPPLAQCRIDCLMPAPVSCVVNWCIDQQIDLDIQNNYI